MIFVGGTEGRAKFGWKGSIREICRFSRSNSVSKVSICREIVGKREQQDREVGWADPRGIDTAGDDVGEDRTVGWGSGRELGGCDWEASVGCGGVDGCG